ncbi:hypothetical protein AB0D59_20090 [Streptomyces sp. NPDC048417]|uniref:hypothetical protein n=1 Tax=Streptomyces sp. NPDC048417 TaxID=3155387 RepID=UPI0034227C15
MDVSAVVAGPGLSAHVKIFHAPAAEATDIDLVIRDTQDLGSSAARHDGFRTRWEAWRAPDPVTTRSSPRLRPVSEWLGVIRTGPRLPVRYLPPDSPAQAAETTFHPVAAGTEAPARRMAADLLDTMPL